MGMSPVAYALRVMKLVNAAAMAKMTSNFLITIPLLSLEIRERRCTFAI
jgi:hypothetical protein